MTHQESFRSRSQAVRNLARQHLLAIRQERIAKRGARFVQLTLEPETQAPSTDTLVEDAICTAESGIIREDSAAATADDAADIADEIPVARTTDGPGFGANLPAADDIGVLALPPSADKAVASPPQPKEDFGRREEPSTPVGEALEDDLAVQRAALNELSDDPAPPRSTRSSSGFGTAAPFFASIRPSVTLNDLAAEAEPTAEDLAADHAVQQTALAELFDEIPAMTRPISEGAVTAAFVTDAGISAEKPEDDLDQTEEPPASLPLASDLAQSMANPLVETEDPLVLAEPAPTSPELGVSTSSDLHDLPGAGPGLVWILDQCGIKTMDDLAKSDATTLTAKLGLVGQILDVGIWLTFARQHVASR